MKKILLFLTVGVVAVLSLYFTPQAFSDELDEINKQLAELTAALDASKKATAPLESQVQNLQAQLTGIESRVATVENDLAEKKILIQKGYEELDENKNLFDKTVRDYYIKSYLLSPLLVFISAADASNITRFIIYQKRDADQNKETITSLALKVVDLETRKNKLEEEEGRLASIKTRLAQDKEELEKIVLGAKDYQAELSGQIAELSSRQQQIIDQRSGSFTFTLGSGELADEYLSSAKGFQEAAPSGHFAIFSFGGYSHRKGMSQYGARGRAESGQDYKEILNKYYGKEPVSKDTGGTIKVAGHGELDFETTYLYGIAEMPSSWHVNALKAQAIAARTYAYRHKQNGSEICITEACQVFNKSKSDNVPESWKKAVDETKGEILEDVITYYASTSGGYLTTSGWDTTDGAGGANFLDKSYERLGNSPWLEKMWWRQGYSNSGNTCGRSNPWLSPEEMADIVNAAIALKTGGIDTSRITPVTTSCWEGNPYSMGELRDLLGSKAISSATSVAVSQGNGTTNSITINGITISGPEFRTAFNLRAPGYLRIPQYPGTYGNPFFNVVRK